MCESSEEMIKEHQKEMKIERSKISNHLIKIRMHQRDFVAKIGGLQRKLKERNEVIKELSQKLESLEFAEEDANELVDDLVQARKIIKEVRISYMELNFKTIISEKRND